MKIVITDKTVAHEFLETFNGWTCVEQVDDVENTSELLPITITERYMYCYGEDEYGNARDIIIAGTDKSDFEASIETLKEMSSEGWRIIDKEE
jgi:hypothetical protein